MKRILYISNISGAKFGISFVGTALSAAKKLGYEFYVVANRSASTQAQIEADEKEYDVHLLHSDICRSPFSLSNYKAYKQIIEIIKKYDIDYIHCNTPVGGVLGRLAGNKCKVKKVIYQAHGFHFYKGAPLINWLLYYPIEKWMAHYTDALITINHEDFEQAKRFHLRNCGKAYYVPGVGINTKDYKSRCFNLEEKREILSVEEADIVVVSAGDLIKRKNYRTAIEAIALADNKKIQYLVCGQGPMKEELENYANELGVESQIHFLGFRSDVKEILGASDIFLFTSFQEGLPRSLSEAMASNLPCVVSKIRGNTDLMVDGVTGFMFQPTDSSGFGKALAILSKDSSLRRRMAAASKKRIEEFDVSKVEQALEKIYRAEFK